MSNIDPRMIKARAALVASHRFFGTLALHLEIVEDEAVETMATDGTRLFYARAFLDKLTPKELEGVLIHEIEHCILLHHVRRGNRNPEEWNVACDLAINPIILNGNFTLPAGALVELEFAGMSAEAIYQKRLTQAQAQPQPQPQPQNGGKSDGKSGSGSPSQRQPQGNDGSASAKQQPTGKSSDGSAQSGSGKSERNANNGAKGSVSAAKRWGEVRDAAPAHAPTELAKAAADWDRLVRQAVSVAQRAGDLPGDVQALIEAARNAQVDWREELRRFIDARTRSDYTWSRPNKHALAQGYIMPSIVNDGISKLGIVVDTSGSVNDRLLTQFVSEVQAAMSDCAIEELVVVHADSMVQKIERFSKDDEIKLNPIGRGGTRFRPALEWFGKNEPDVAAVVYLTDLEASDFGEEPMFPVLWAGYGEQTRIRYWGSKVPFGEVIHVTEW